MTCCLSCRNGCKTFEPTWPKGACSPTPQYFWLKWSTISHDVVTTACNHTVGVGGRHETASSRLKNQKRRDLQSTVASVALPSSNLVPGSRSCLLFSASVYLTSNLSVPFWSFFDSEFNSGPYHIAVFCATYNGHHTFAAASNETFPYRPLAASETTPLAAVKSAV